MRIAIDAGHGLPTPERRTLPNLGYRVWQEWELNDRITVKIIDQLQDYEGVELLRLDDPTGAVDVPLHERSGAANDWGADLVISNHHNAGANSTSAGGIEVYRYPNSTLFTRDMQKRLYDKLIEWTGLRGNRVSPLGEQNFHMLREPYAPAVLIEYGYMDSITDVPIIITDEFATQSAHAVVEWLEEEYDLVKKTEEEPPEEDPPPVEPPPTGPITQGTFVRINADKELLLQNEIVEVDSSDGSPRILEDGTILITELVEGNDGYRLQDDGTLLIQELFEGEDL